MKKEQIMFFSDDDFQLLKDTFANNNALLKALRSFLLQLPLTEFEEKLLVGIKKSKEVLKLLRKVFLPTLDLDVPIGQLMDLWKALDVNGKPKEEAEALIISRNTLIKYLDQQLKKLEGYEAEEIIFNEILTADVPNAEMYPRFLARNGIIAQVDGWCSQVKAMAAREEQTLEEAVNEMKKNSSK